MMVDREIFRDAMARLGAAVNVVTSIGPSGRVGFTASAVCSVTDEPPMLIVCMNRASRLNPAFKESGMLCVNALAASQEHLSGVFAGQTGVDMDGRFATARWSTLVTGAPVLQGCVTSFDCRIAEVTEVGTHSVFFCRVAGILIGPTQEGLIYFAREYHSVSAMVARNPGCGGTPKPTRSEAPRQIPTDALTPS
ncbi:flavin reductase [Rhizobiales bacterium GAS113]|nr:flavin reductase [Rhizobiales bacterium GAS113]